MTIGSPSLLISQAPPKPAHRVLPSVGPATRAPVVLSNTAKERFTHCTYWVKPTAPLVSGGAQHGEKPGGVPCPRPSKLSPTVGASGVGAAEVAAAANRRCSTGSGTCAGLKP